MRSMRRALWLLGCVGLVPFWALSSHAGVTVEIDTASLNDLLSAATLQEVSVPITDQRKLTVLMDNLEVTGLDPAARNIKTSMRLRVPEIGLAVTVDPRVSLTVANEKDDSFLELRFDEVELPLPLAGPINIAGLLPPLRFPADHLWLVAGARGDVFVRSRLSRIAMGSRAISLEFEIDVRPRQEAD